jgi:hypothetical protein
MEFMFGQSIVGPSRWQRFCRRRGGILSRDPVNPTDHLPLDTLALKV